jgi:enoyl-CoA hydratase/carnithine racemase
VTVYEHILVEKAAGVAILTMNRPEQLNAMNHQLSSELHDAVTRMDGDDEVGCIVITGAGTRAFSAGGDIHEQRENDRTYTQAELLFSGRVVEAEEAHRIGLLNHLVPCAQLREKTLELGTMIAKNRRESVMGIKALMLQHMGGTLEEQWKNEQDYTHRVYRGARADQAFPELIARKGRALRGQERV